MAAATTVKYQIVVGSRGGREAEAGNRQMGACCGVICIAGKESEAGRGSGRGAAATRAEPIVVGPVLFSYGQLFSVSWLVARFEKIDVACNTATTSNNQQQQQQPVDAAKAQNNFFSFFFCFFVVSFSLLLFLYVPPFFAGAPVVATLTR